MAMQKLSYLAVTAVVGCVSIGTATAQIAPSNPAKPTSSNVERRVVLPAATAVPGDVTNGMNAAAVAVAKSSVPFAATGQTSGSSIPMAAFVAPVPEGISAERITPEPDFANRYRVASLTSSDSAGGAAAPQSKQYSPIHTALPSAITPAATSSPTHQISGASPKPSAATPVRSASIQKAAIPKTAKANAVNPKGSRARSK
jgi:hypothetical protein